VLARLMLGGALWLGAMFLFAAGLQTPPPARHEPEPWSITQMRTAHHAMIVDVVAQRVAEAATIADEIVALSRGRGYAEILVYVRGAGERGQPAERRVQWTPEGGFSELVIRD
jgi:hypothetical protein